VATETRICNAIAMRPNVMFLVGEYVLSVVENERKVVFSTVAPSWFGTPVLSSAHFVGKIPISRTIFNAC